MWLQVLFFRNLLFETGLSLIPGSSVIQVAQMASASEPQISSCLCLFSAEIIGTGFAKVSIFFLDVGPECDRGLHGLLMTEPETSELCIFSVER